MEPKVLHETYFINEKYQVYNFIREQTCDSNDSWDESSLSLVAGRPPESRLV